jgi:hypothetical protein
MPRVILYANYKMGTDQVGTDQKHGLAVGELVASLGLIETE